METQSHNLEEIITSNGFVETQSHNEIITDMGKDISVTNMEKKDTNNGIVETQSHNEIIIKEKDISVTNIEKKATNDDIMEQKNKEIILTEEQCAIIETLPQPKQYFCGNARAGAGKTTTLEYLTLKFSAILFYYICFNKSVEEEATRRFGNNVVCKTIDALAHEKFKEKNPYSTISSFWPLDIMLSYCVTKNLTSHFEGYKMRTLLEAFCNSDKDDIMPCHLDEAEIEPHNRQKYTALATELFGVMAYQSHLIPCTFPVARKMLHLEKVVFPCNVIIVDEANDLNQVMKGILDNNVATKGILLIGDSMQRIYDFMNNINLLEEVLAAKTFHLTKCQRFGPTIRDFMNDILKRYEDMEKPQYPILPFATNEKKDLIIPSIRPLLYDPEYYERVCTHVGKSSFNRICFLFYSNVAMIERLEAFVTHPLYQPSSIHISGWEEATERIYHYMNLYQSSYAVFQRELVRAKKTFNLAVSRVMEYVAKPRLQHKLPVVLNLIKNSINCSSETLLCFSTIHKFKGLEADVVVLGKDILLPTGREKNVKERQEKWRRFYTAATRVRIVLVLNNKLRYLITDTSWLKQKEKKIEKKEYAMEIKRKGKEQELAFCKRMHSLQ